MYKKPLILVQSMKQESTGSTVLSTAKSINLYKRYHYSMKFDMFQFAHMTLLEILSTPQGPIGKRNAPGCVTHTFLVKEGIKQLLNNCFQLITSLQLMSLCKLL